MPFPDQDTKEYNRQNVESMDPNQFGCYGLYRHGHWIYVGKGDIRERLLDHINGDNPCIALEEPTHWVDIVTADMDNEEKRLILEFDPACTIRVG